MIRFEWDPAKNAANRRKHGVSFEEAAQVFLDPLHLVVADRVIDGEERWQALGAAWTGAGVLILLTVAHTVRDTIDQGTPVEVIRIISARRATSKERSVYEEEIG